MLAPGQIGRLYLELHNVGEASARNVVVSIAGANFVPELSSSVKTVGSLQPNEHATVWQELRVVPNVESGAHPVTVSLSYTDETGSPYTGNETVGITVLAPTPTVKPQAGKPQIVIESFTAEPPPVTGGTFTLTLTLHNSGTGAAHEHRADARRAQQLRCARHGQRDTRGEHRLAANGRGGDPTDRRSGRQGRRQLASHHPGLRQRRGRARAERTERRHPGGQGEAAPATPEPLVVIESYVTEPEPLTPGKPFTLTLRVLNVGAADARG